MNTTRSVRWVQTAAPAVEPLTLTETKLFLRVDHSDEDDLITGIIKTVRELTEQHVRRALITQSWRLEMDDYADNPTRLPMGPAQSITLVEQVAEDATRTTVGSSGYRLDAAHEAVCFSSVPIAHQIHITYVAGYGDAAADLPEPLRQGMLHYAAVLYDRRGAKEGGLPEVTRRLFAPYRLMEV